MISRRQLRAALGAAALCAFSSAPIAASTDPGVRQNAATKVVVTVQTRGGPRQFRVEVARTPAEQERGLMFRTNIPADGGMIFTPYPAVGRPREASFWMKNTPTPLDIIFIRSNGTIASIAANAVPFSETSVRSGEPVRAVLEILGGKAAELGIAPGDKVSWQGQER